MDAFATCDLDHDLRNMDEWTNKWTDERGRRTAGKLSTFTNTVRFH